MSLSHPPVRAPASQALLRALRGTCPACGLGRVFHTGFVSEKRCDACGWWFERGPGHWVGGSEVNMLLTYWAACITFITLNVVVGFSWVSLVLAGAFTIGFSLLIYRVSRCLFFALDYLIDPQLDASHGEADGDDGASPPEAPLAPTLTPGAPAGDGRAQNPLS